MSLYKAASTQRSYKTFQTTSNESRKFWKDALYLTIKRTSRLVRKLARQVQLVNKNTDKYNVVAK